jgi:hypothetical protein
MRRVFLAGVALALALAAQPAFAAPDLDLRDNYAHRRCHGGENTGEGLTVGVPGQEAKAIAASQGRVKRSGKVLTLGKVRLKTRMVDGEGDGGEEFEYLGGWARSGLEVVFVLRYEDLAWRLIDPRSGQSVEMGGPPLASPNGKAIAAVGDDSLISEFNGIEIVDYKDGRFESQAIDADYACDPVWLSDEVLQLKVLSPKYRDRNGELLAGELPPSAWRTTRVIRKNGEWTLVPPHP